MKLKKFLLLLLVIVFSKVKAQFAAYSIADSLYRLGNYAEAINEYAKVGDETSGLQIARAYNAIGNYEKAILQYTLILEDAPDLVLARFELGKLALKTKDFGTAKRTFDALVEKDPGNPEYRYYLGRVMQKQGDVNAANSSFVNAVKLDNTHLRSLFALGKFYVGVQQKDSAFKYIDKGLQFYENDVSLINLKALAYFNDGQYNRAIPYFEKLLALGEEKPFIYEKLGFSYFRDGQLDKAKENYRELANNPNKLANAYRGLGEVFMKQEVLDSAEYYIHKYIGERKPDFSSEYADLGRIARVKGHTQKALDHYYKAWQENTENPFFYYQFCTLADEYYKDPHQKLANYQKFLDLYENSMPFLEKRVEKRIVALKEEIHFSKD